MSTVPAPRQLYDRATDLHFAAKAMERPKDLTSGRASSMLFGLRNSDDAIVRATLVEAQEKGWWPYLSHQVYTGSIFSTAIVPSVRLLSAGAHLPRYNANYEPLLFLSLDTDGELQLPLFDAMLALGMGVNDHDMELNNIFEHRLRRAIHRYSAIPSNSPMAARLISDLTDLLTAGADVAIRSHEPIAHLTRQSPELAEGIRAVIATAECARMEHTTAPAPRARSTSRL